MANDLCKRNVLDLLNRLWRLFPDGFYIRSDRGMALVALSHHIRVPTGLFRLCMTLEGATGYRSGHTCLCQSRCGGRSRCVFRAREGYTHAIGWYGHYSCQRHTCGIADR